MARFFCDNCGAEVKRSAASCPRCGRSFASVKCPQCGFTGEAELFSKGCPICGYCEPEQGSNSTESARGLSRNVKQKNPSAASGKLPPWVYILAVIALIGVVLALFRMA